MAELASVVLTFDDGSTRTLLAAEAQRWFAWVQAHVDWDLIDAEDGVAPFVWTETP